VREKFGYHNIINMRTIIQRVKYAKVTVEGNILAKIENGLVVFLGIASTDGEKDICYIADKIINLRVFKDKNNKMNLSLIDIKGSILIISQFTLYANCSKGNRPSFIKASNPIYAKKIYNEFVNYMITKKSIKVETGKFGANMQVDLLNDGPVTLMLNTDEQSKH
jgi:D-tyrosyl-tRNA(Tyr) deacylase